MNIKPFTKAMKILLFGSYREKAGTSEFDIQASNVVELRQKMAIRFPFLSNAKFAISINCRVAQGNETLVGNEEIALMPPYSGG